MPEGKGCNTKSLVLRVDADTVKAFEAWAADASSPVNGRLQWPITEALRKAGSMHKAMHKATDRLPADN